MAARLEAGEHVDGLMLAHRLKTQARGLYGYFWLGQCSSLNASFRIC